MNSSLFNAEVRPMGAVALTFQQFESLAGAASRVDASRIDVEKLKSEVEKSGYSIVKGLVDRAAFEELRAFWIDFYAKAQPPKGRVIWSPYYGQPNVLGYSDDRFQRLFRYCDFYWNPATHEPTRSMCQQLNLIRNLILGWAPLRGLFFEPNGYGMFATSSHYPAQGGWMRAHVDGLASREWLVHHILPLTFKGRDYQDGGMYLLDRAGRKIDIDAVAEPGDAIFYDATLQHGVDPIGESLHDKGVGRIQIFGIPSNFKSRELTEEAVQNLPGRLFVKAKINKFRRSLSRLLGIGRALR